MKKKSLKKVTSAVLVAAMSMGLLAGCGGSKSSEEAKTDADGATVIKFGIHVANPKKQETVTYNIVQGFNKENKGKYKVEFVAADTEAHSKNMKLAAQDGSLPEIVHLDSAEAPEYNEAGYLLDMSDFLKENKDNLTGKNVREGLTAVISVKHPNPQFEGQTKTKLGNSEVVKITNRLISEAFSDFL